MTHGTWHGEVSGLWVNKLMHNEAFIRRLFPPLNHSHQPQQQQQQHLKREKDPENGPSSLSSPGLQAFF